MVINNFSDENLIVVKSELSEKLRFRPNKNNFLN